MRRAALVLALAGLAAFVAPTAAGAHGDDVLAGDVWSTWTFEPLVVVSALAALGLFVQAWLRLRRRGRSDHAGLDRLALFAAGIAIVVLGVVSPLDPVAEEYLQSAHMLQHVLIADLGVALVVLALRGPLVFFFLPRPALVRVARSTLARRAARVLSRPAVALPLWLGVLVVWHVPFLYEAALESTVVHDVEHVAFVAVGTLVWVILVDPTRHGRLRVTERMAAAAVVFWASQILAYVIVFDPTPLFDTYAAQDERLLGLSPLADQKIAGVVMMVEQLLTVGACFLYLLRTARRERDGASAPAHVL